MDFPHIDDALEVCHRHLSTLDDGLPDTVEIASLLVASIVLLIVSTYENYIAGQFAERATRSGDQHLANFVARHTARRLWSPKIGKITEVRRLWSPKIGKITEVLGEFGTDYRDVFRARVENTIGHASWDNLMQARHTIVHKNSATNMTLRELQTTYKEAQDVLAVLRASLGLSGSAATTP